MAGSRGARVRCLSVQLAIASVALILPSFALATTRYASPAGAGPASSCPLANPCSLQDALAYGSTQDGDEVIVLPGDYATSGFVGTARALFIHGLTPGPRPTVHVSGQSSVSLGNPGAVISDLKIVGPPYDPAAPPSSPLYIGRGTGERLEVTAYGSRFACELDSFTDYPALLRDSVCWNRDRRGRAGVGIYAAGGGPLSNYLARVVNVTAISPGSGLRIWALNGGTGTIEGTNVVARSDPAVSLPDQEGDVVAETAPPYTSAPAGAAAAINLTNSNYATVGEFGAGSTVTPAGSGANRTAAPRFADPLAGDFRQVSGSPTIDAGAAVPLLGSLDFEGEARVQGAAVDAGGDEGSIAAPFRLSADQRQSLRDLGLEVRCRLPSCVLQVQGTITIHSSGGHQALAGKRVALKNRRVVLGSGQSETVALEPLTQRRTVARALAKGAKETAKVSVSGGAGGFADQAKIRIVR